LNSAYFDLVLVLALLEAKGRTIPGFAEFSRAPSFLNAVMAGVSFWYLSRTEVRQVFGRYRV